MKIDNSQGALLGTTLNKKAKEQAKIMEQMATGKRINRASDDAAGLSMAKEFEKQVREYRQASDNLYDGMSATAIQDGAASGISDMLQRQRELAVQGANGALNTNDRAALDQEFQQLSQEIDRVAKSTDFNGQNLLDGTSALSNGTGKIVAGNGPSDSITLSATDMTASGLNLGGVSLLTPGSALAAMTSIDNAMRSVTDQRATTGATENRFEYAASSTDNQYVNTMKSLSNIEDLDYAQAQTDKVRNDILSNTGAAALSQFNQLSRTHLLSLLQ